MKPFDFISRNRLFSIIILIGILILLLGFIGNQLIKSNIKNWPEQNEEKIISIKNEIINSIDYAQHKLLLQKNSIVEHISEISDTSFNSFQKSLSNLNDNDLKLVIYKDDNLIYWNDKYSENLSIDDTIKFDFGEIYFLQSDINTYLALKDTIRIIDQIFELNFYKIIEKHYRLNADYFVKTSLSQDISERTGIEVEIAHSLFTLFQMVSAK